MSAETTIVTGTSGPLLFQILDNGLPLDITDFTVTLLLTGSDGSNISTSVKVVGPTVGVVSYTPGASDLSSTVSPIKARWVLTEDIGSVYYIPSAYRDEWDIVPL